MRLDESIILRSPQITNPLDERELDLRGNGITLLDEVPLSQLMDSFDVIDLTDNSLTAIEYIPEMKRLTTIIAHRNRLQRFSLSAALRLPNLHTFVADDNAFSSLDQLVVFSKMPKLLRISLGGSNRVAQHEHFRGFLIYLCPTLKLINFQRVLQSEREASAALKKTFDAVIRQASGAAAMSMVLAEETKAARKRGRHAAARTAGGAASATVANGAPDHSFLSEDLHGADAGALDRKIDELQAKIDEAQTEEEISALMEEMEALQEVMERKRARKK